MGDRRGIENGRHHRVAPECHVVPESGLHRGVGNAAEGVICEMRQQIGEEDEATG